MRARHEGSSHQIEGPTRHASARYEVANCPEGRKRVVVQNVTPIPWTEERHKEEVIEPFADFQAAEKDNLLRQLSQGRGDGDDRF